MNAAPDVHTRKLRLARELGQVQDRIKLAKAAGDLPWLRELVDEKQTLQKQLDELCGRRAP